jgi:hypothetical protein
MSSVNATTGGAAGTTASTQNGGGLKGIPPSPFSGDRTQSAQFKREMLRYMKLNEGHELIKEPYSRILYCLLLFKGPGVELWVNEVEDAMERAIADPATALTKNSIQLWNDFLATFDRDWTDSLNKEKAYQRLITLKMQPGQLDDYILTFQRLAGIAGWDKNAPGTIEFFKKGLPSGLFRACLMRNPIPTDMNTWQDACRAETQRYKLLKAGPGMGRLGPTQSTQNNRPRRDPNAMEVDATASTPSFKKLTDDERKQYMKEGRCFRCRQQGHMARECSRPSPRSQTSARTTETKEAETEEAPPYSPPASTSSVSASTSEDKVRQAHALVQAMSAEEKRRYYALDQDFSDADL